MIELLPGQRFDDGVMQSLDRVSVEAGNAPNDQSPVFGLLKWATNSESVLRSLLPRNEIERLLHTTRYWHVASTPHTNDIIKLANDELDDAKWRWDAELAEVKAELQKWSGASEIIVADTNIFLHQPKRLRNSQDLWMGFVR